MTQNDAPAATISAASERKLREGMARLLDGVPTRTDGRLLKENLYKEAGVSRATMNRATAVLAEWEQAVTGPQPPNAELAQTNAEISKLRRTVQDLRSQVVDLQEQIVAAASVISTQHNQIMDLRDRVPTASVTPMLRPSRAFRS